MSAQIIGALRERANRLDAEACALSRASTLAEAQQMTGRLALRDRHQLLFLAEEFRALADEAEAR
jgi:hypothetical protein